jgi:hypothetical protein
MTESYAEDSETTEPSDDTETTHHDDVVEHPDAELPHPPEIPTEDDDVTPGSS